MNEIAMAGIPTVFIVDDEKNAQRSIAALVEARGQNAETFDSAAEFLAAYDDDRPGCLVTDWIMPEIDGLMLQEQLLARGCRLPVILVTAHACTPTIVKAMKLGALTALDKPYNDDKLWDAIQEALKIDERLRLGELQHRELRERLAKLTQDEVDVFELILQGMLNKLIAKRLDISLRTVEKRRHSLFEKMQAESTAELVCMVLEARRKDSE
jgi:FixJ family two-component response regulator